LFYSAVEFWLRHCTKIARKKKVRGGGGGKDQTVGKTKTHDPKREQGAEVNRVLPPATQMDHTK